MRKVLIIDDDEVCTMVVEMILKSVNEYLEIAGCVDGKEAIDYLLAKKTHVTELPDIILLDINMPIMDGWEFLKSYKKILPNLKKRPIIWMLSSTMLVEELERAKSCSLLSGFISKPFSKENALELLNSN